MAPQAFALPQACPAVVLPPAPPLDLSNDPKPLLACDFPLALLPPPGALAARSRAHAHTHTHTRKRPRPRSHHPAAAALVVHRPGPDAWAGFYLPPPGMRDSFAHALAGLGRAAALARVARQVDALADCVLVQIAAYMPAHAAVEYDLGPRVRALAARLFLDHAAAAGHPAAALGAALSLASKLTGVHPHIVGARMVARVTRRPPDAVTAAEYGLCVAADWRFSKAMHAFEDL